jgi:hypothetical protein
MKGQCLQPKSYPFKNEVKRVMKLADNCLIFSMLHETQIERSTVIL